MNGIRKNTAVVLLALPMMFMILHDIIPHHHHDHQIVPVECSHDHHEDHHDSHEGCCSDEEEPCEENHCLACKFEPEFIKESTSPHISAVIPFVIINIEEPEKVIFEPNPLDIPETFRGFSLSKFLRGPPSC